RTMNECHSPLGRSLLARGKERPVRCPIGGSLDLTTEDRQLVAKDNDLEIGLGRSALVRPEQTENATQEEIEERRDHGAALWKIDDVGRPPGADRVSLPHASAWSARAAP
nr:hypothetical protein [Actinomycetota bacterium]